MLDPTLRDCTIGLLFAALRHTKKRKGGPQIALHFQDQRPVRAVLAGHLPPSRAQQLRDDLKALKVPYHCEYTRHATTWMRLTAELA